MSKVVFCSFADSKMKKALSRIKKQAEEMNVYDDVYVYTEKDLDVDFSLWLNSKIATHPRGYGYWCWKPQVIIQTLDKVSEGDIIHYADSGCHLNVKGRGRFFEYIDMVNSSAKGMLTFKTIKPSGKLFNKTFIYQQWLEKEWTKADLISFFALQKNQSILDSQQIEATTLLIKKSNASVELISHWRDVLMNNFELVTDDFNINNDACFIEHRHDQSVFSIICKMNDVESISSFEYQLPSNLANNSKNEWQLLDEYPIHAKRDRGLSFFLKVKNKLKKLK